MLENGTYSTIKEIAESEKIAETYVGRVLMLNLLAPDIVELILTGRHPPQISLSAMMQCFRHSGENNAGTLRFRL
jgi:hypothetical protein